MVRSFNFFTVSKSCDAATIDTGNHISLPEADLPRYKSIIGDVMIVDT